MTDITITVVLKPSGELTMLAEALITSLDCLIAQYRRGGAAQVARDDAEPHKATKPETQGHRAAAGDPDSKAPVLPDPIPQTPHVAAAPQRAAMEAITPAAVAGTVAGGPKAPLPEPTGLAMAAQNGGDVENEAPAPAAVTCNRSAAGAPVSPRKPARTTSWERIKQAALHDGIVLRGPADLPSYNLTRAHRGWPTFAIKQPGAPT